MKFAGKLLISDMDGTLLDSKHHVSTQNIEAIKYFTENGGLFTLASGRMVKAVEPYLEMLPINAPAILYNGSVIYDFNNKKILWETYLDNEVLELTRKVMEELSYTGIELFHGSDLYIIRENEHTLNHIRREKLEPFYKSFSEAPRDVYKVIVAADPSKIPEVSRYLAGEAVGYNCRYVSSEPQFLELLPPFVSKGDALSRLIKIINISTENVVAVGDNYNDLEMISNAGVGIAVSNACDQLKKAACHMCASNNEHCISDIIDRWESFCG